jgi:hypothetical protein
MHAAITITINITTCRSKKKEQEQSSNAGSPCHHSLSSAKLRSAATTLLLHFTLKEREKGEERE